MSGYSNQSNSLAIVVVVVVAVAASFILATTLPSFTPGTTTTTTITGNQTYPSFPPIENLTEHAPIFIESNGAFSEQADSEGWLGNGSVDEPYIVQGYSFDSPDMGIHIAYTTVYFVVRDCAFTSTSSEFMTIGVDIWEAENGLVERCQFMDLEWGVNLFMADSCVAVDNYMTRTDFGVNISYSSNSAVIGNVIWNASMGMLIDKSSNFNISDNILMYNDYSMDIWYSTGGHIKYNNVTCNVHGVIVSGLSSECRVMFNTIFHNEGLGIDIREFTNSIEVFGNLIGWNTGGNAKDDGTSNSWDDGINIGNGWSDYSGEGVYSIPGNAESIDHFPTLIEY